MKITKNKSFKKQKGGVAPSCVTHSYAQKIGCNKSANSHNNPRTSKRKSKKMKGGRRHPSSCGCSSKKSSFNDYILAVKKDLGQIGGGYTSDPSRQIAGKPIIQKYDDCCQPAIINSKLVMGSPGSSICGSSMIGGSVSKNNKRLKKNKSIAKKFNKSKKTRKSKKSKKQKGGHYSRSKPAKYPDSHETNKSHFGEVTEKDFSQRQPFFDEMAI